MSNDKDEPSLVTRSATGEPTDAREARLVEALSLATEYLRAERLSDVRTALERATALAPDDLRVLNLRGLYLFRAERFAEAREVYRVLVIDHPRDAALRLNLGLVELKLGEHRAAAENLKYVIAAEPNNQRAQGYLGLALMRGGELRQAKQAFSRAGQHELEERVATRLAEQEEEGNLQRSELERAASLGSALLDGDQPFLAPEDEGGGAEAPRDGGRWQLRVAGERLPLPSEDPGQRTPLLSMSRAEPVAAFASARMLRGAAGAEAFALAEGGLLVTTVVEHVHTRTIGAITSSAELRFEPLSRRARGQTIAEVFGDDDDTMFVAKGRGTMLVSPRGGYFVLLRLEDDIVYVRESLAFAFEDSLVFENGRVPGADALRIVQFRGQGRLVLRSAVPLFTLKVEPGSTHIVDSTALGGWFGRVQPKMMRDDDGAPTPYIECSGEGVLLIEEPK